MKLICGLLGKKLGHSYSPAIHAQLSDYEYGLFEKTEDEVEDFIRNGNWDALNVTIPYKKTVFPFLDSVGATGKKIESINTLVKKNGKIYGDNTDVYGFTMLVKKTGIDISGKKALVLGSGGASVAVLASLEELGARSVIISRSGENNYGNLNLHSDAEVIVNTTPVGMYPNTGEAPLDLRLFPNLKAVFDIIYNPAKTALLLQAQELGIPCANGLYMLVAQAKRSSEIFEGTVIDDSKIDEIYNSLCLTMQNYILVGMPGSGKTTTAEELAHLTGREVFDSDEEIKKRTGKTPSEIITESGEEAFRKIETSVLADLGKLSGKIIATGGGVVTREENYGLLHQNGVVVRVKRDNSVLATNDRPISQKVGIEELARIREPMYRHFADITVDLPYGREKAGRNVLEAVQNYYKKL